MIFLDPRTFQDDAAGRYRTGDLTFCLDKHYCSPYSVYSRRTFYLFMISLSFNCSSALLFYVAKGVFSSGANWLLNAS